MTLSFRLRSTAMLVTTAALLATNGCAELGTATAPIGVDWIAADCATRVDTLLVLLPGAYDKPDDFIRQGFVEAVRARGIAADLALVNATVAYYRERDIVARLAADVIAPARARGIRHVWIAGISIGGLGGLLFANEQRGAVDGLLLVAPYLGGRSIAAEISASGGLAAWAPTGTIAADDDDRRLWQWLKVLTTSAPRATPMPAIYLGYGIDDRFAASDHLLAAALPGGHVFTAPGGHDWQAWRAVWPTMLDAAPLPRDASCASSRRSLR